MTRIATALIILSIARNAFSAVRYQSRIMNQRVVHYENDYIDFSARYFGEEGSPYLLLKDSITPYSDLHILLYARVYDQPPNYLVTAPLSLCRLLHDESVDSHDLYVKQFNIPQIFNFAGRSCPIESPVVRLSPYRFPANFSLETDIGCGYMNVEAKLLKCDDGLDAHGNFQDRNCLTLLKIVTLAFLVNDACSQDSGFARLISDGLTDAPIVLTPYFPAPGQTNEAWLHNNVDRHGAAPSLNRNSSKEL